MFHVDCECFYFMIEYIYHDRMDYEYEDFLEFWSKKMFDLLCTFQGHLPSFSNTR